jgi:hypothetical protein
VLTSLEAGRAEFKRQVAWLMRLGNAVSSQRCVVLAGPAAAPLAGPAAPTLAGPAGAPTPAAPTASPATAPPTWCVWQVVREQATLAHQMRQALEIQRPAKETAQIMAFAAGEFVAALQEFGLRAVELPIHFNTLARENGAIVYSAFLPQTAIPASDRDPLTDLASELRAHVRADRLAHLNVPEALRELERLREQRPQIVPTVEVLQSLLIGE